MLKEFKRGILIIATNHGYYGRLAYNLAVTIKAAEKDVPVALVYDEEGLSHLSEYQSNIFDILIPLPPGKRDGFSAKVHLYELSPFEETLFVDADMLWLNLTPSQFFNEMKDVEYTGITEGWYDIDAKDNSNSNLQYYYWADIEEILSVYGFDSGRLYQWRSEVIYFKKTERVAKLFEDAIDILDEPRLNTIAKFGERIPDELAFNISAKINGIKPHIDKWTPAYWHKINNDDIPPAHALSEWYLVSFGGHHSSGTVKREYDNICKVAFSKMKRTHLFSLHSKKEYLKERATM
jgi:hypothetical protein